MLRLRGRPAGGGTALGTATVLHAPIGIPMLPARIVAEMQRRPRDSAFESIDIVLVADRFSQTVGVTIPWGKVVAVLCEQDEVVESALTPTVTGVPNLLQAVQDDTLVLVDGDRGIVLIDPDSVAVAAFQSEKERLSPRRRLFLDFVHQPAHTSDGRVIHVWARATNLDEASTAVENGADSVVIACADALAGMESDDEQTFGLIELGRAASGKPVVILGEFESTSAIALLRAAQRFEFTLALPAHRGPDTFRAAREQLEETRHTLVEEEIDFGDVRLAAEFTPEAEIDGNLAELLVNRVVLTGISADGDHRELDWISDMVVEAAGILVPALVETSDPSEENVSRLIGLGAAGLVVPPDSVGTVKEIVRKLSYEACRWAVSGGK